MKVPLEGGQPITLMEPAIEIEGSRFSPDGSEVAFYIFPEGSGTSKTAIMNSAGGQPTKTFDLAPAGRVPEWDYSLLHWTPDGKALTYPLLQGSEMNLWIQPVAGGPPRKITHFNDRIQSYDWSPDGERLVVTRSKTSSDVVLISNFR